MPTTDSGLWLPDTAKGADAQAAIAEAQRIVDYARTISLPGAPVREASPVIPWSPFIEHIWNPFRTNTVTFRSAATLVSGTGTSVTGTEPTSAASGDALVALYIVDKGFSPALPASWISLYTVASASQFDVKVGYIIRGAGAPSYAFTHTGSHFRELYLMALQGSGGPVTFDSQSSAGSTYTSNATPNPPSTTALASSSLAVAVWAHWHGSTGTGWALSTYTVRVGAGAGGPDAGMATKSLAAPGAEDPAQVTNNGGTTVSDSTHDGWNGGTFTFTDVKSMPIFQRTWRRMERRA